MHRGARSVWVRRKVAGASLILYLDAYSDTKKLLSDGVSCFGFQGWIASEGRLPVPTANGLGV